MKRILVDLRPDSMKSSVIAGKVREILIRLLVYSMCTDHWVPLNAHLKRKLTIYFRQNIRIHHKKRSHAEKKKILVYNVEFAKKKYNYGSYRDHLKNKHPKHDFTNLARLPES